MTCRRWITVLAAGLAVSAGIGAASASPAEVDWSSVEKEAAILLSDTIRIDTTNPPGNEAPAAEFLAAHFRSAGLEESLIESAPGRSSVLARLPGQNRTRRPVVLLSHLDVVPAAAEGWPHPPFAGVVRDGYVHGRGALDCKGIAVIEAMAMLVLHRSGTPLARDVIFLGTPDEEAGGHMGADRIVEQHFSTLGAPEFLLNEGGAIREREPGRRAYEVAVAEKTPFWLRLTAHGEAGHGSTPRGESAVTRLVGALERIRRFEPRIHVTPEVARQYRALAPLYPDGPVRRRFLDLPAALAEPAARSEFLANPVDAALVRNTIAITVLKAGEKTNVIPATASAEIDCRLLPGEDPERFLAELRSLVADDSIDFEVLLRFPPSSSTTDSALYRAIESVAAEERLPVVPSVLRGFTDSHYFRARDVVSYGFIPIVVTESDERGMHGVDERISLENLREGTRRLVAILTALDRIDAADRAAGGSAAP